MSSPSRIRLLGGRVVDPIRGRDEVADLVMEAGKIVGVAPETGSADGEVRVDVTGWIVAPGFVDLHCHLREPGFEDVETIHTGTRAAAAGGFTTVCAMPDTSPPVDTASDVEALARLVQREAVVRVLPVGTTTKRREGKELSEMGDMAAAGAVYFADDRPGGTPPRLLRHALEYAAICGRPVADRPQDGDLALGGVMHEGPLATRLGLRGVPLEAEEVAVFRGLALARLTRGRLHLSALSARTALEPLRRAKEAGLAVSADVTAHHLALTDTYVEGSRAGRPYDTNAKTEPPLRSDEDRLALIWGLCDGTIDCVATDHEPRRWVDKACEFDQAAPGISALETTLGLLMRLVHAGQLSIVQAVAALTSRPSAVLQLALGTLTEGAPADVVVFDPNQTWTVDVAHFRSLGKNSPLQGETLLGRVLLTFVGAVAVYDPAALTGPATG